MSNPDIPNQDCYRINTLNDFINNSKVCLFNYSNLKSQKKLTLSQFNKFNYDLSGNELHDIKYDKINSLSEAENSCYIKHINIEIPSSEKLLSNEEYKTSFINEYEESFPCFCGLNKDQFTKLYINNIYRPSVDELGDINFFLENVAEVLEVFSENKKLKMRRRYHKRNRNRIKKAMKEQNSNLAQNKAKNMFQIFLSDKMEKKNEKEKSLYDLSDKEKKKKIVVMIMKNC